MKGWNFAGLLAQSWVCPSLYFAALTGARTLSANFGLHTTIRSVDFVLVKQVVLLIGLLLA